MSEKSDHWKEIVELVKDNARQQYSTTEELDPKRKAELQSSVYSHIDGIFPAGKQDTSNTVNSAARKADQTQPVPGSGSLLDWIRDRLTIPPLAVGASAMAMVLIAVVSVGLMNKSSNDLLNPYFDVPEVIRSANLDSQIRPVVSGSRALLATDSERKTAFITGVMQAGVDLGSIENETVKGNIVSVYTELFSDNKNASTEAVLDRFQSQVTDTTSDEKLSLWFKEGYKTEIAYLSAQSTLATFKIGALQESLRYFQDPGVMEADTVGLNPAYLEKRLRLTEIANTVSDTEAADFLKVPENIQQIIDLTSALKVLPH